MLSGTCRSTRSWTCSFLLDPKSGDPSFFSHTSALFLPDFWSFSFHLFPSRSVLLPSTASSSAGRHSPVPNCLPRSVHPVGKLSSSDRASTGRYRRCGGHAFRPRRATIPATHRVHVPGSQFPPRVSDSLMIPFSSIPCYACTGCRRGRSPNTLLTRCKGAGLDASS